MKIVGNSKQDGIPKPDNPVEIKNETILIITDKEENKKETPFKYEKILKEGDKIEKINGEWCLVRRKPMNDIEILEELTNGFDNLISYKQKQAIENLIQENKELYEIKYIASKFTNRPMKQFSIGEFKYRVNNYIEWKDKIREKIEEIKKYEDYKPLDDRFTYKELINYGIEILQELL